MLDPTGRNNKLSYRPLINSSVFFLLIMNKYTYKHKFHICSLFLCLFKCLCKIQFVFVVFLGKSTDSVIDSIPDSAVILNRVD